MICDLLIGTISISVILLLIWVWCEMTTDDGSYDWWEERF